MELEFVEKFLNLLSTYIFLLKNLKLEQKFLELGKNSWKNFSNNLHSFYTLLIQNQDLKLEQKFFEQPLFNLCSNTLFKILAGKNFSFNLGFCNRRI